MKKPAPVKAVRAWALVGKSDHFRSHSFAGRIAVYSSDKLAKEQRLFGERVIPVEIVPLEDGK